MTFKKPNLKAPRFRKKTYNVLNKQLYNEFLEKYPNHNISYKTFCNIIKAANTKMWNEIIENRDGIELPESLGFLFIGTCVAKNPERKNVNYGESIKRGYQVLHQNWETDGNIAKIFYTSYASKYKVKDRNIWYFDACRNFARTTKSYYVENWTKYVKISNHLKISRLYYRDLMTAVEREHDENDISNYNEFNF